MNTPTLALALLASACATEEAPEPIVQDAGIDNLSEAQTLVQRAMSGDVSGLGADFFADSGTSLLWDKDLCDDPNMQFNGVTLSAAKAVSTPDMTIVEPVHSSLHLMNLGYARICGDDADTVSEFRMPVRNAGDTQDTYGDLLAFHERMVTARGYTLDQ